MKILIAALVALSAVATAANAMPFPPTFDGPAFGPSDIRTFDGPQFGPKDLPPVEGPGFGPSDVRSFDGPAQTWTEGGNQR